MADLSVEPADAGLQSAVGMQFEHAAAGTAIVGLEAGDLRPELHAGGGRGEHTHCTEALLALLVDMATDQGAHRRQARDDRLKRCAVAQSDAIKPGAAHRDRLMVQHHQRVRWTARPERSLEARQFGGGQFARSLSRDGAVEHDDPPRAQIVVTEMPEGRFGERLAEQLRVVVVARDAKHRLCLRSPVIR